MSFTTTRLRSQFGQAQQLQRSGQATMADMLARQIVVSLLPGITGETLGDAFDAGPVSNWSGAFADIETEPKKMLATQDRP